MKISSTPDPASLASQASAAQKASQSAGPAAAATANATKAPRSAGVSVTVSTQVRGLEEAKRSDVADVDVRKVAAVRASIQDGSFKVNAEAIADKLLSNAQEVLSRTNR